MFGFERIDGSFFSSVAVVDLEYGNFFASPGKSSVGGVTVLFVVVRDVNRTLRSPSHGCKEVTVWNLSVCF